MKAAIHDYAIFGWCILCALLGVGAEWTGQVLYTAGRWLMTSASRLSDYALRVSEWDVSRND
jgi:hypothetical protein